MYKIGFITNDSDLIRGFRNTDIFKGFTVFNRLDDVKDVDVIIISDKLVGFNELINKPIDISHLYYMVSNENYSNQILDVLKAQGFNYIPPKLTTKQIVENITSKLLINVKKLNENAIVFYGADNKVGTTMVAQSVAERIANTKKIKVLLMFLDGTKGTDYTQDIQFSSNLDNLKVKLYNKIVNESEINEIIERNGTLHILQGTASLLDRRHYNPGHIEFLIDLVSKKYDAIIIDAGSNIELGMVIGALNAASQRFLIANQKNKSLNNFSQVYEQALLKLDLKDFLLVINQFVDNPYLPIPYHIAEELKLPLISTINYFDIGWQAEKEHKTLLNYDLIEYEKSIDRIVSIIAKKVGFEYGVQEEKTWLGKIKEKLIG